MHRVPKPARGAPQHRHIVQGSRTGPHSFGGCQRQIITKQICPKPCTLALRVRHGAASKCSPVKGQKTQAAEM